MRNFKIIVEKHPDGYVAYPLGLKGAVVGEGESYEEALTASNLYPGRNSPRRFS